MYFIEIIAQKFYMQLLSFKNFSFIRCVVIFGSSYKNEMLKNCKSEKSFFRCTWFEMLFVKEV